MIPEEIMLVAKSYSMTSGANILATVQAINDIDRGIPGDIVECGVWRGGHIIAAMLAASTDRVYWLFDTFDGMTEPGPQDTRHGYHATDTIKYRKGGPKNWCRSEIQEVQQNIDAWRRPDQTVIYKQGPVEQTLTAQDLPEKIALLRLDTDFYASTRIELEVLWPRVVPGGVMIIDDYGSWDGCRQAVHEYFGDDFDFTPLDGKSIRIDKND